MNKRLVDWDWYSNGKRVYYRLRNEIKHADARTFEPLNHVWAWDATRVFQRDKILRLADRETFVVLNELFAKDAKAVYYTEGQIKGADPETFMAFAPDDECGLRSYAKDAHNVYHRVFTVGKAIVVRKADPSSFRPVGRGYGIDGQSVFYEAHRLKGADPATWHQFPGGNYSRDKKSVYYGSQLVAGVDLGSFEVLPGSYVGRDSKNYFRNGQTISQNEYRNELLKCFVFTGTVVEAGVTDRHGNWIPGAHISDVTRDQGIEFQIECERLLFSPDVEVDEPPVAGKRLRLVSRFNSCDISQWIGQRWIWFFHPLSAPNCRKLCPIRNWRYFSPVQDLDQVISLVHEFVRKSAS